MIEKVIKKKGDKLYVKWKVTIVYSIAGLVKRTQCNSIDCIKTSQYFPKPYELFGGDINVKVDFSNYATKIKTDINRYQKYFAY